MAAARRYAIAQYDLLGWRDCSTRLPRLGTIFIVLLAVLIGLGVYSVHGPMPTDTLQFFTLSPPGRS